MTTTLLPADLLHLIALMSPERVLRIQAVARSFRLDTVANFHVRRAARFLSTTIERTRRHARMVLLIGHKCDGPVLNLYVDAAALCGLYRCKILIGNKIKRCGRYSASF